MFNSGDETQEIPSGAATSVPIDLWDVCDTALDRAGALIRSKALDCGCWIRPGEAAAFKGDAPRLLDILSHLLSTAAAYSQPGGEMILHVSAEDEDDRTARLRFAISGDRVEVPSEEIRRRVAAFFEETRPDYASLPVEPWSGWVLARRLIREMGGEAGFETTPEIGSTFWFSAPLEKRPEPPVPPASVPVHGLVLGLRPVARRILADQLRSLGLQAVPVGEAGEAAHRLGAPNAPAPFDLVAIDLSTTFRQTVEAAQAVISKVWNAGTPLVILSQGDETAVPEFLEGHKISVCLQKPVTRRQWAEIVRRLGKTDPTESRTRPDRRVLVVEDDDIIRKITLALLAKLGLEADAASDGPEALSAAKSRPYDVILMDCQLPGMDGYETTRQIRGHEAATRARPARILAVTNDPRRKNLQKCLDAGMDDCLNKPLRREELRQSLQKWLAEDASPENAEPAAGRDAARAGGLSANREAPVNLRRLWKCADGDRQELRHLLEAYFQDLDLQLAQIGAAIRKGDFAEVSRRAHRAGGVSATLGMTALLDVLYQLETMDQGQASSQAAASFAQAQERLAQIHQFLKTQPETA